MMGSLESIGALQTKLHRSSFSICQHFNLSWYNSSMPDELGARIPTAGKAGENALGVLIGNGKELWDVFAAACKSQPSILEQSNPLDTWVVQTLTSIVNSQAMPPSRIYWAHVPASDLEGGAPFVAMQRLAEAIGLAYLDPNSHLCLHPKYGPWFSMRAVLVYDDIEYQGVRPQPLPCPLDPKTQQYVKFVARSARNSSISRSASASSDCTPLGNTPCGSPTHTPSRNTPTATPPGSLPRTPSALLPARSSAGTPGGAPLEPSRLSNEHPRATTVTTISPATPTQAAALLIANGAERAPHGPLQGPLGPFEGSADRMSIDSILGFQRSDSEGTLPPLSPLREGLGGPFGSPAKAKGPLELAFDGESPAMLRMSGSELVKACWEKWVAVRDAPFPGHPYRFYKDQIAYHYTQDIDILHKAINAQPATPLRIVTRTQSVTQLPWVLSYTT